MENKNSFIKPDHDIIILDREYIIFTVKIFGDDENEQKISKT